MPDPSEPRPGEPEEPGGEPRAPTGLRRRVLARVRSEPEASGTGAVHALRRARRRGRRRSLAAVLLAVGALGVISAVLLRDRAPAQDRIRLGGPAWRTGLGAARASLRRVGGHAELRLSGMPQPPVGEVYEVWLRGRGSAPRPTNALFNVTSSGTAAVEVPGSLRGSPRGDGHSRARRRERPSDGPTVLSVALRRPPASAGRATSSTSSAHAAA